MLIHPRFRACSVDMTHPVQSLHPFLHAIGAEGGSTEDQAGLLASIERDDDKEPRPDTSTAPPGCRHRGKYYLEDPRGEM